MGSDRVGSAQEAVEVAPDPAGGELVVARIDEVGSDLGRGDGHPPAPEGRHQPGGDRRLADARVGPRDHHPRPERHRGTDRSSVPIINP